jgi:hypothetical protein
MPAKAVIQHRRDSQSDWGDVVLASGEIGYVDSGTNAGNFKIGDGETAFSALPYVRTFPETITASTGLTKTGSDIRAVFGTDAGEVLEGDHAALTNGVHGIVSPAVIVGTSTVQELSNKTFANFIEKINVVADNPAATQAIDVATSAIWYFTTNADTNYILNFTNIGTVLTTNGQSITVTVMHTNGTTAYFPTAFQIGGTSVTPKWQVSSIPQAGDPSSINSYNFTILRTASDTYTVFASQSRFD